jgi:hypothetical protein
MKVKVLVAILILIVLGYFLFMKYTEEFTPSPYVISWQAPSGCTDCSYDWKICSDDSCNTIIDQGNTKELHTQTSKLDFANTYSIQVRANNKYGSGEWTKGTFSTGNGVLSAISIGSFIDNDGQFVKPILAGQPSDLMIWTTLTTTLTVPITLEALITVTKDDKLVTKWIIYMLETPTKDKKSLGYFGSLTGSKYDTYTFDTGDVINVDITAWDANGNVVSEITGTTTVSQSGPGTVSSLKFGYAAIQKETSPWFPFYNTWLGGNKIGNDTTGTLDQCLAACINQSSCDYAYYQTGNQTCSLYQMTPVSDDVTTIAALKNTPNTGNQYKVYKASLNQSNTINSIPSQDLATCANNCLQTPQCLTAAFYGDNRQNPCVLQSGNNEGQGNHSYLKLQQVGNPPQ